MAVMFKIPIAAKLVVSTGAGLLLLGATSPAVYAKTPAASHAASTAAGKTQAKGGHDHRQDRRVALAAYLQASAGVLGMSPQDLRKALKAGKSLEDLATAKGMTKETFGSAVTKAATPLLEAAVDSHKLTRAEATRFEKRLAAGHLPYWTRGHKK